MKDANIGALELALHELGSLADDFVFVGGATVGLYITDKAVPSVRATSDVDCVVEVASRREYHTLEAKLKKLGFSPSMDGPQCRFTKGSLILDVMPTDEEILGFSNRWYRPGIESSQTKRLPSGAKISVFDEFHFLASKLEAFKGRGKGDFYASHDLEDIVAVLDGQIDFEKVVGNAGTEIRSYLKTEFNLLLTNSSFREAVEGHIADRSNAPERCRVVLQRMNLF